MALQRAHCTGQDNAADVTCTFGQLTATVMHRVIECRGTPAAHYCTTQRQLLPARHGVASAWASAARMGRQSFCMSSG